MRIIKSLDELETSLPYPVFSIGNFDGLHIGHQKIIRTVVQRARENAGTAGVMTFDPHPMRILAPHVDFKQIQTLEQKVLLFNRLGVDILILLPFTKELAQCSALDFATKIVSDKLKVKELYVGTNFAFGKGRQGNIDLLEKIGAERNFKVGRIDEIKFRGLRVSSSCIRQLVLDGRVSLIRRALNRPYSISGTVVSGNKVGSSLGFPTANISPDNELLPRFGVYITYFFFRGKRYHSVTNIGTRPTFTSDRTNPDPSIETYVFGLNDELYGQQIALDFCYRLRDEKKFANPEALAAQIRKDITRATKYFGSLERRQPT